MTVTLTPEQLAEIRQHVDAGVAWCEEKYPGQLATIPVNRLAMRDPHLCLLGHIGAAVGLSMGCHLEPVREDEPELGVYVDDRSGYDWLKTRHGLRYDELVGLGFTTVDSYAKAHWQALEAEWIRRITELQRGR